MKKISITWDDLADIPDEDYAEGRVVMTGLVGGDVTVASADLGTLTPYLTLAPNGGILHRATFRALGLGLVREAEERPNGVIPAEPWAHIVLGDGRHAVLGDSEDPHPWLVPCAGSYDWWPRSSVQALANEHGFKVLVPEARVEEAREEGRLAGIREAHDACKSPAGFSWERAARTQIKNTFPEAFEEGDR